MLWKEVHEWIQGIGFGSYGLEIEIIILGKAKKIVWHWCSIEASPLESQEILRWCESTKKNTGIYITLYLPYLILLKKFDIEGLMHCLWAAHCVVVAADLDLEFHF